MSGRGNPAPDLPRDDRPCSTIRFEVDLIDVVEPVAKRLEAGRILEVRLVQARFPAAFDGLNDDDRLGSIASGALSRLVECLRSGEAFAAEIRDLDFPLVRVEVRHA